MSCNNLILWRRNGNTSLWGQCILAGFALLAVLFTGVTAQAATYTWTGGASTNWNNAGDWSTLPTSGGFLEFATSGAFGTALTDDLMASAGSTVSGITFDAGASAYTISPSTALNGFTLSGPIANNSTNLQIINDPIIMTAARTFTTTAGGGNITLGGNLSGSGGSIGIAGGGLLTLTGSNSFTAGIALSSAGSLQLQANAGNSTGGTTAVMPAQGMSLAQLPPGSTIELRADSTQAVNGIVEFNATSGTFGANSAGNRLNGTLNFDVNDISSGSNLTLQFGSSAATWVVGTVTGGTFNVTGGNGYTLQLGNFTVGNNGPLTFNPSTANMIIGNIANPGSTDTGGVTKNGAGNLTISGACTYSGATQVFAGTLVVSGTAGSGITTVFSGSLVIANTAALVNSIFDCSGTGTVNFGALQSATFGGLQGASTGSALTLTNTNGQAVALTLNGQNTTTSYGGNINGLGSLIANTTAHSLVLGGSNTYAGNTTIAGGAFGLIIRGSGTLGPGGNYAGNISIASGDTFTYNSTANQILSGQISGSGALTQSGPGLLTLTASNTYTGLTTLSGGTLNLGSASALAGLSGTGGITFNTTSGGALQYSALNTQDLSANIVNSTVAIGVDTNGLNVTYANPIAASNTGGLTKYGAGTLTLAASNGFGGVTLVSNGTLLLTNSAALSGSTFDPSGAGTFSFGGLTGAAFGGLQTASTAAVLTLTNTASAPVALTVGGNNASTTFSGLLTDIGAGASLTKLGSGALTLAGTSSLAGTTTISGGVLAFSATTAIPYAIPGAGQITIGTGGALAATPILSSGTTNPVNDWLNTGLIAANPSGAIALANAASDSEAIALSSTTSTLSLGAVLGGSATYSGTLTPSGTTYYLGGGGGKLTYTPQIGGANSLVIGNGGLFGNVLLTNTTNNYAGPTTIAGGTLSLTSSAALPSSGNITFTGGTFQPNSTVDYSSRFVNSTGPIAIDTNGLSLTYTTAFAASNTGGVSKIGAGSLTLTASNTYSANTTISAGTLAIGGNGSLGLGNNYGGNIADSGVFFYASTAAQTLSGNISGGGSLIQSSSNVFSQSSGIALTVSGSNTYTGATTIHAGRLNYSGTLSGNTNTFTVADTAGQNAVATLSGNITANNMSIGATGSSAGAVYQTGGNVNFTQGANVADFALGASGTGAAGYYKLSGGSLNSNEVGVGGGNGNGSIGVMDITGGTFSDNGYITIGHGTGASSGVLNVTGGVVLWGAGNLAAGPLELNWATTGPATSVINVGGGTGAVTVTGTSSTTTSAQFAGFGLNLAGGNVAGTQGIANLLSNGTLTTCDVVASQGATSTSLLNFNGGTLKATATNTGVNWIRSGNISGIYIYSGGATIDDNGTAVTVNNSLLAPTGSGVTTIAVSSSGSGYIGAPMVLVSGGTGRGGTAVANMVDDGTGHGTYKIASITITNPGVYTGAPTTVTLTGGSGSSTTGATIGAITMVTNTGGGLTKAASGILTLSGSNNYTGTTLVSGGTLLLANQNALSQSSFSTSSPGTLSFGTLNAATFGGLTGAGNLALLNATPAPINLSAGNNNVNSTYGGTLTGSGGTLTKVGTGLLNLAGSNGYGGGTVVSVGTLQLGNDNALGSTTAPLTISASGVLDLNGHSPDPGAFSGNGTVDNLSASTTGTLTVGTDNSSSNFAGTLQGSAGVVRLAKAGTGTLTLSGTSTSSNVLTAVNNGTLLVNGKLGGSGVTVQNTTTLGGSGTITSPVTLANGSTLTADLPGAGNGLPLGVGPLTFGSASSDISTINFALGTGVTPTAGTINVAGALTVNSGAGKVTINLDALSTAATGTYAILKYTGASLSAPSFAAFNFVGRPSRMAATLVNDMGNDSIDLNITGQDKPVWTGSLSTAWDTSTSNWVLQSNHSVATQYINSPSPDNVVFDDTALAGHTAVTISGNNVSPASVTFNNNVDNYTVSGANGIAGLGALTKNGSGTVTISTSNSYSGGTFVNAGVLQVGNAAALGSVAGGLTVNGGTLDLNGVSPTVGALKSSTALGTVTSNNGPATLTVQTVAPSTYSGAIADGAGQVSLTVSGSSVVTLAGNNTYSGLTLLKGGELGVASAGAIPSGGTITFAGGALQHSTGNMLDYSAQIFNSTGPIAIDTNGQAVTYASAFDVSNTGGLSKLGAGSLTLTASNVYAATTTISGGTLSIGGAGVLGATGNYANNIAIGSGAMLNYNSTSAQTFGGAISGSGALTQTGSSVLVLTATNTYSGGTTVSGSGSLISLGDNIVGSESTVTALGSGPVAIVNGGQINAAPGSTGTNYPIGNTITLDGGKFWQADGNQQLSGPLSIGPSGGTLLASWGNKSLTVTNIISGSSQLTIGNNGTGSGGLVIVTNANSFSGTVDVSGNLGGAVTLQLTNANAFANAIVNADGGTFTYGPAAMIFGALEGSGSLALPTTTLTIGGIGANTTYSGVMSGAGGLTIQGPGALTLTTGQALSGPLAVAGGTLSLPSIASTFGSLSGTNSGTLILAGDFTVTQTTAGTYAGSIAGAGNLNLSGSSTAPLTLTGNSTFSGNTTLNGGTLALDYTANNGAKLGGGFLTINKATITLKGGSQTEQMLFTSFGDGTDQVLQLSGSSILGLGGISATPGAVVTFSGSGVASTTNPNDAGGILGAQYTVAGVGFAANSGVAVSGGSLIAAATTVPFAPSNTNTQNVLLIGNGTRGDARQANTLTLGTSGAGQSLNLSGVGTYKLSDGGLLFTGTDNYTVSGGSLGSGTGQLIVVQNGTGLLTINSAIVDDASQALVKLGPGTLALGGANSYSGVTTIAAGTLRVTSASALGSNPSAGATVSNGATLDVQANIGIENITAGGSGVGGSGALINSSTSAVGTLGGSITLTADTTLGGAGNLNITGNINSSFNLFEAGPGTTTVSGNNSWANTTISGGTLAVSGASALPANNLSFTDASGGLNIGAGVNQSFNQLSQVSAGTPSMNNTISGGGTLTLIQGALQVGASTTGAGSQTLDMSGLATFVYNNTSGSVEVGGSQSGGTGNLGVLNLARNNSITAALFSAGYFGGNNGTGTTCSNSGTINLGQMNTIDANRIGIADGTKNQGTVQFLAGLSNPTLVVRDISGGNTATMLVGFNNSGQVPTFGTIDLVTGVTGNSTLDAVISSGTIAEDIGNGGGGTGQPATGIFNMGHGTLDAQNLVIGQSLRAADSGSLGIYGGRASIGTLTLGIQSSGATSSPTATVTLDSGGTLDATTVQSGSGSATRIFNWNSGTIANLNSTIQGTTGLTVSIPTLTMAASGTHAFWIDPGQSGTVSSNIGQVGGPASLFMTGGGTLTLSGTNSYTGITEVLNGTLILTSPSAIEDGNNLFVGSSAPFAPVIPASAVPSSAAIAPVPEPGTLGLLAAGLTATLIVARRRKRFGTARRR